MPLLKLNIFRKNDDYISGGLYRVKKMAMFQITLINSSLDAACAPEHFDTLFNEIGQKFRGAGQKTISSEGVCDPPIHFIKLAYLGSCITYLDDFGVYFYVIWDKEFIFNNKMV